MLERLIRHRVGDGTLDRPGRAKYSRDMRSRGLLQRTLTIPWCRALVIAGVWVFAMEAVQLPLLTAPAAATCCCDHRSADSKCQCRVCTHQRELESGRAVLKTCGTSSSAWVVVSIPRHPAIPAAVPAPQAVAALPAIDLQLPLPPPDPLFEVPTPPPLARS
jgi:hypothetical protein